MKLEIKHLAPYLPYNLKMQITHAFGFIETRTLSLDCGHDFNLLLSKNGVKPILLPMSGFPLYFEYLFDTTDDQNIKDFLDEDFLYDKGIYSWEELVFAEPNYIPYGTLQVLLKYHFDVFELIPAGLAVSIHDIGKVVA